MRKKKRNKIMLIVAVLFVLFGILIALFYLLSKDLQIAPDDSSAAIETIKAFPSAGGQGKIAKGGRGGRVIKVTNLNGSGPGSFRDALQAGGARIVVFDVGGEIDLDAPIEIKNSNITIAGQTAPAPGINIKGAGLKIKADEVIIRHIAIRPGSHQGDENDSIQISEGSKNIMLDHLSLSFSIDEVFSTHKSNAYFVTLQNSIVAFPLNCSKHSKGCHGYSFLIDGDSKNISLINNLSGFATRRHPKVKEATTIEVVGNYFRTTKEKCQISKKVHASMVENIYENPMNCYKLCDDEGGSIYTRNNTCDGNLIDAEKDHKAENPPFPLEKGIGLTGNQLKEYLLQNAGKTKPIRDDLDKEIVKRFRERSKEIIDHPRELNGGYDLIPDGPTKRTYNDSDQDGIPNDWELANGLNPNLPADANQNAKNGYTNIENYINSLAGDTVSNCTPKCEGKICGDNGCGGKCGVCNAGDICEDGECVIDEPSDQPLPSCHSLKTDKSVVRSKDEVVKIDVSGSGKDYGIPDKVELFISAGSQKNMKPEDFICERDNVSDPQYSYYCKGLDVWYQFGLEENSKTLSVETTFQDLTDLITESAEEKGVEFEGDLDDKGIQITANISDNGKLCTSNLALNNGKGAYKNGEEWEECNGGCNILLKYDPNAPEEPKKCDGECVDDDDCEGDLVCEDNKCRDAGCLESDECSCSEKKSTDINDDDKVDILDISLILNKWGDEAEVEMKEDVNSDGVIDILDISLVINDWTG